MIAQPSYFEPIRARAAKRWEQLEHDPELAGPWHQLFKQVQSPRHVLSELLQNADDAGATEAWVRIEDGVFRFSHNGEDFTEEHFSSLCRFGYSNKRALHTIGFRGIGFKSTFSLGDTVELRTPTLALAFHRKRFTAPTWLASSQPSEGRTEVRVAFKDMLCKRELEKNLDEWLKSPVSLLFFQHIRRLSIGDSVAHWESLGRGPVPDTERLVLHADVDKTFLIARSAAEPFPTEALSEIQQERLLNIDSDFDFPPCKVEIVLGAKGRLYVVLPTGVKTILPFACNAPFIQDPGRLKIKDPEISPTNQWLLKRLGSLAASVMLQWLRCTSTSLVERAHAYQLFPSTAHADEETCATIVKDAFNAAIQGQSYLLTDNGELQPAQKSVIIPDEIFGVWPAEQAAVLLDDAHRPVLSRHVSYTNRQKLKQSGAIEEISKNNLLNLLQTKHLPKPQSWNQLLTLWAYFAPELTGYQQDAKKKTTCIIPVQGKEVLYSANEVVRLGEEKLLQSEADWQFLETYLLVLNQNWLRFLAEQRRKAEEHRDSASRDDVDAAYALLKTSGLEQSSDVSKVIEQVAVSFFNQQSIEMADCSIEMADCSIEMADYIRFTQIAAKLRAAVGEAFRFITQDQRLRAIKEIILFDQDGTLEQLLPADWRAAHLLDTGYVRAFESCTLDDWKRWISSSRSGLHVFAPLVPHRLNYRGKAKMLAELDRRRFQGQLSYAYKTEHYRVEDWDFEQSLWHHWEVLAHDDDRLWGRIAERIFAQPETFWSKAKSARLLQISTHETKKPITYDPLLPTWILKLQDLPCLLDTRGIYHKPSDLLRRTQETESFIDVEPFVHSRFDTEATRPLLTLLGVRDTPPGPDRVLDCLRALATAENPPIHEVEKWYRRLDQMVDTCSTADLQTIKQAFRSEKLIFTDTAAWVGASGVFLTTDEDDVPGAAVVRASVRDLTLWRKIGIAERPTVERALHWLKELPVDQVLSPEDLRRVRALLPRHPLRIWEECGHWLNLLGQWESVDIFRYALTLQALVPWSHLHESVKRQTADLQRLPAETTDALPFSDLALLSSCIEERFHRSPLSSGCSERKAWLSQLGAVLQRIELDDEADTARVRGLAANLTDTVWQTTAGLEIIPYIDRTPAGTPRRAEVAWLGKILYAEDRPSARLARAVSQELGRAFGRQDITDAFKLCFDRSPEFVAEYVEENFKLAPGVPEEPTTDENAPTINEVPTVEGTENTAHSQSDPPVGETGISESDDENVPMPYAVPDEEGQEEENHEGDPYKPNEIELGPLKERHRPKPPKPSIFEQFARAQGFHKDGADRFHHADGSWIAKLSGRPFPWEKRSASGDLICSYWPKDHCLEREPLQLEADLWWLIKESPDKSALILSNLQGDPIEVRGERLLRMCEQGDLTLYPATYRLVWRHDDDQ